jgi:hypothetical protein
VISRRNVLVLLNFAHLLPWHRVYTWRTVHPNKGV